MSQGRIRPFILLLMAIGLCLLAPVAQADGITLSVGETVNVRCNYFYRDKSFTWVTANSDIAYIRNTGTRYTTLTGIHPGTTTYTCYYYYYKPAIVDYIGIYPVMGYITDVISYTIPVTVKAAPTGITFAASQATMGVNTTGYPLSFSLSPSGSGCSQSTWSSSDTSVATINNNTNKITTLQPGQTTIKLTLYNGVNESYTLTVSGPKCYITGIGLSSYSISQNRNLTLSTTVYGGRTDYKNKFEIYNESTDEMVGTIDYTTGSASWKCVQMGDFYAIAYVKDNDTGIITTKRSNTFTVTQMQPERYATELTLSATSVSLRKMVTLTGTIGGTTGDWEASIDVLNTATGDTVYTIGYGSTLTAAFTAQAMGTYQGVLRVRCKTTNIVTTKQSEIFTITEMVPESSITGVGLSATQCKFGEALVATLQVSAGGSYRTSIDVFDKITGRRLYTTDRTEGKTTYTFTCPEKGLQLYVLGYVECMETGLVTTKGSDLFQVLMNYEAPLTVSSVTYLAGGPVKDGRYNAMAIYTPYVWRAAVQGSQGDCLYQYTVYTTDSNLPVAYTSGYSSSNLCTFALFGDMPNNYTISGSMRLRVKVDVWNDNGGHSTAYSDWTAAATSLHSVRDTYVKKVTCEPDTLSLEVGESYQLAPTIEPTNATYPTIYYLKESGDFQSIRLSDDGKITALTQGEVFVRLTALDFYDDPAFTIAKVTVMPLDLDLPVLPGSLTTIAREAFLGAALTDCRIPDRVTSIGDSAFKDCSSLEKIIIPPSVTSIGPDVFSGCDNLRVFCEEGSAAQAYCETNDIEYRLIDVDSID